MNISNSAYEHLLKEYEEKQLAATRDLRMRLNRIEEQIPEIGDINSHIAALSVDMAVQRIRGNHSGGQKFAEQRNALLMRKEQLLREHGYTSSDLEPHYECSLCHDTGYVDNRPCRCFRSKMIEILYDQSNIREILQKENFDNYTFKYYNTEALPDGSGESPLSIAQKAVIKAKEFVNNFESSSDNLFIGGSTGTGKTFLSNCIARELLEKGYGVIYLSAVKLFSILADSAFGGKTSVDRSEDLFSCDLLIIDDLGTEYTNSFVQSAFFNCINERLIRNRHTIISTNLSFEQIRDNYSERVFSRITENYILIRLFGKDIRIMKKLEG